MVRFSFQKQVMFYNKLTREHQWSLWILFLECKILYYGLHAKIIDLNTFGKLLVLRRQYILHNKLTVTLFFFKNNLRRLYSNFTDFFQRDSVRDFHWIKQSNYPSDNLVYLHLFKAHNYHYWFIKSYCIKLLINAALIHTPIKIKRCIWKWRTY